MFLSAINSSNLARISKSQMKTNAHHSTKPSNQLNLLCGNAEAVREAMHR